MNLTSLAKKLRRNPTEAEKTVWRFLRDGQTGYKFRRQQNIGGRYIVDFVCLEKRLVVEIDGGQHTEEKDRERTTFLKEEGFITLRFWNNDVLQNAEGVFSEIERILALSPPPWPSPLKGEGEKRAVK